MDLWQFTMDRSLPSGPDKALKLILRVQYDTEIFSSHKAVKTKLNGHSGDVELRQHCQIEQMLQKALRYKTNDCNIK